MSKSSARKKPTLQETRNLRTLLLLSVFDAEAIGDRIRQARKETGATIEDFAALINVSTRSLSGYERGEVIPYKHIKRIAAVSGKPEQWLLHGDEARPNVTSPAPAPMVERAELAEILLLLRRILERLPDPGEPDREGSASV